MIDREECRIKAVYADYETDDARQQRYAYRNPAHLRHLQCIERGIQHALVTVGIADLRKQRILEVGCGDGYWLRECLKWGARPEHLTGIDLLPSRIARAKTLCPPAVTLDCGNGAALPYRHHQFDMAMQFTVFSSILDGWVQNQMAAELRRVVKPGGVVLWYDLAMNNPRNPHVIGIGKREIARLFPGCQIRLRRVSLAPPLARLIAPYSVGLCSVLEYTKIFNMSYLGIIKMPSSSELKMGFAKGLLIQAETEDFA